MNKSKQNTESNINHESVCIPYGNNRTGAIDYAVWMNFEVRNEAVAPFRVIEPKEGVYLLVSKDMLDLFKDAKEHPLPRDYENMTFSEVNLRVNTADICYPFDVIYECLSDMEPEVLRFILTKKIPLAHLIRYILLDTTEVIA
jgi:hypothetical protein